MTDVNSSNTSVNPTPETGHSHASAELKPRNILGVSAVVILLVLLVAMTWQWLSTRHRFNHVEQVLTQRLEQYAATNQQASAQAKLAEERSIQAMSKTELLEQKLAQSRDEQENLETLYKELTNSREERTIAEIEQLLIIANQQLQLAGNIRPALLALQTAYSRLQQIETPQAALLRKTVLDDIQHLQNLPQANIADLNLELEALARMVDAIPLVSDRHPEALPAKPGSETNAWRRLAREVWEDVKSLVRLERIDRPEPPLLSPEQTFFLRENVKLRLLMARIALLQQDGKSYRHNMESAAEWIKQHFDVTAPKTLKVLSRIRGLADDAVDSQIPDINDSLGLVSKYKLSLEKTPLATAPSAEVSGQE
jgi:uroporphyrin-3 C-methyltransferase